MMVNNKNQQWIVIADFFRAESDLWLDDFIDDKCISFKKLVPFHARRDWHQGKSRYTSLSRWIRHFIHARSAIHQQPDGIITCFPQLAICAAIWKSIYRSKSRIIAYNFNLGELRKGYRQWLARLFSSNIDCFVVHSPEEVVRYAKYLDVEIDRIKFLPLQRGKSNVQRNEEIDDPFVIAMGSAHRDYPTLIKAVDRLKLKTIIITRASDVSTLPKSPYVQFISGISNSECLEMLAKARICVTPIANMTTASGQITFINSMQLGVPVVVTNCPGAEGYVVNGDNGVLVKPFDIDDMVSAISILWNNDQLRAKYARSGIVAAEELFSDQAAAEKLTLIIRTMTCT